MKHDDFGQIICAPYVRIKKFLFLMINERGKSNRIGDPHLFRKINVSNVINVL